MCKEIKEKFQELYSLDVNKYVEKKQGLSYLTWSFAWAEFKKIYPDATYTISKDENGKCYFGDENIGYMVYTSVTAGGLTYEMWLPVMDNANKSMKAFPYTYKVADWQWDATQGKKVKVREIEKTVEAISMFDINKTVMRCLVKNLAMFGLGLYIYAGEDLPENIIEYTCQDCGCEIKGAKKDGIIKTAKEINDATGGLCVKCYNKKLPKNEGAKEQ
jgi:hypothetical protein